MRAAQLAIGFGLAIWIASACGGRQPTGFDDPRKTEITTLWAQIREWRREAGWPVDPRREDVLAVVGTPVRDVQRVCTADHEVPQTCGDVCNLSEAICDNAESICSLADELGKKDSWAQDKCSNAKASCREAKKKCCGCSESAPPSTGSPARAPAPPSPPSKAPAP